MEKLTSYIRHDLADLVPLCIEEGFLDGAPGIHFAMMEPPRAHDTRHAGLAVMVDVIADSTPAWIVK